MKDVFYEVVIGDCDYRSVVMHVWKSGTITYSKGNRQSAKRLIRFFHEPDAPPWVRDVVEKSFNIDLGKGIK